MAVEHSGWDRLIAARRGSGIVRTTAFACELRPDRAVWVEQGEYADIDAGPRLDLRIAYVRPGAQRTRAVAMTPLGRELLERCVDVGWLDPRDPRDARFLAVVFDELDALRPCSSRGELALPLDPRGRCAAERALEFEAAALATARELAHVAGCSARTLERLFVRDTGLGVVAWQRRYRLLRAAAALGCGVDVTTAGFDAGYAGTSAFVTAYRRAFGTTPGRRPRAE